MRVMHILHRNGNKPRLCTLPHMLHVRTRQKVQDNSYRMLPQPTAIVQMALQYDVVRLRIKNPYAIQWQQASTVHTV